MMRGLTVRLIVVQVITFVLIGSLGGCALPARLSDGGLPVDIPEIPGIPGDLQSIEGLLEDLGVPDLTSIGDLPGVDSLPGMQARPGVMNYRGPVERSIEVGSRLPGTDIVLAEVGENTATFMIDGLRSERRLGDSLDFDGNWPSTPDVAYYARLRIYRIGNNLVRVAGVHQLEIGNIVPTPGVLGGEVTEQEPVMNFPFTTQAGVGEQFGGITYGYLGEHERGAELSGLDGDTYPYRKLGDSIDWDGFIRADIPVSYRLRLIYYGENRAQIGGVVRVYLSD